MTTRRRFKFLLSSVLALVLAGGSTLPPAALWQCRHAVRVVSASFLPQHSVMPCAMSTPPDIPHMACCPPVSRSARQASESSPACHPTLTRSVLARARVSAPHITLRRTLAAFSFVALPHAACPPPVPDTLSLRQRPPPRLVCLIFPKHTPGLRAPPAA